MNNGPFDDVPIIFSYTRKQAIEDGVLVDLTEWAKETGFVIPVACTAAIWHDWIVPPQATAGLGQSERGRAHDVLWMLYLAIRQGGHGDQIHFKVIFLQEPNRQKTASFKALCGPGDQGEPVVTILLPHED